jgi:hypothetical protein
LVLVLGLLVFWSFGLLVFFFGLVCRGLGRGLGLGFPRRTTFVELQILVEPRDGRLSTSTVVA